ncbi:hypothetical protein AUJ14_01130 [Candidatus Micrarchaeota archaeon CG1_02_55_22]|nr:MAG: hypothetical protein AUJ14_01130 [Candidatus Micrarchaeota archaeon CG1_02_55_22]
MTTITQLRRQAKDLKFADTAKPSPEQMSVFMPIGDTGEKMGDGLPIRAADWMSRKDFLNSYFSAPNTKEGNAASVYKAAFYFVVCLVLTIVTFFWVNHYIAAVFAFLTGKYWSDRVVNYAWAVKWYGGRPLIHTA